MDDVIGGFRLISQLGEGGMATAWLARAEDVDVRHVNPAIMSRNVSRAVWGKPDPPWQPLWDLIRFFPFALKTMNPSLADDPKARLRFAREVNAAHKAADWERFTTSLAAASVTYDMPSFAERFTAVPVAWRIPVRMPDDRSPHASERWTPTRPNTPDPEPAWAAFEFLPGRTVTELMARGACKPGAAAALLHGLGNALASLHEAGVVHRDVKPSNVIWLSAGPMLIDFGIARDDGADLTRMTTAGKTIGTPAYMSPEQVKGAEVTAASDVFSAAVTVVATMLRRSPFERGDIYPTLLAVTGDDPDLSALAAAHAGQTPYGFWELLRAALEKDPASRPTAAELAAARFDKPLLDTDFDAENDIWQNACLLAE